VSCEHICYFLYLNQHHIRQYLWLSKSPCTIWCCPFLFLLLCISFLYFKRCENFDGAILVARLGLPFAIILPPSQRRSRSNSISTRTPKIAQLCLGVHVRALPYLCIYTTYILYPYVLYLSAIVLQRIACPRSCWQAAAGVINLSSMPIDGQTGRPARARP
jgi:hypothetical protein